MQVSLACALIFKPGFLRAVIPGLVTLLLHM